MAKWGLSDAAARSAQCYSTAQYEHEERKKVKRGSFGGKRQEAEAEAEADRHHSTAHSVSLHHLRETSIKTSVRAAPAWTAPSDQPIKVRHS